MGQAIASNVNHLKAGAGESSVLLSRKKIWIDLDNSPHVPFFAPIIKHLEERNYELIITGRNAFQVVELVERFKLSCRTIGRHYGRRKTFKVVGALIRALQLKFALTGQKPDLALSHGSRSQLIAATLLRIPSIVIIDYEFVKILPLRPTWVMAPKVIPESAIQFRRDRILRYPGIKEDVYVPQFKPDPSLRSKLGLKEDGVLVTLRPPANEAHYHNPESDYLFRAAMQFLGTKPEVQVVLLPRTKAQANQARNLWPGLFAIRKIVIPDHVVDGLNLLWISDLAISGGGTMNREAAALGVPVYSIFRGRTGAVDRYLSETGRLVFLATAEDIRNKVVLARRRKPDTLGTEHLPALKTIVENVVKVTESGCLVKPHWVQS